MNEMVSHHRAVLGVLRYAQIPASWSHMSACRPSYACSDRMNSRGSYGYSVTVSAEGHGSMNELVSHQQAVSSVLRDAQTDI